MKFFKNLSLKAKLLFGYYLTAIILMGSLVGALYESKIINNVTMDLVGTYMANKDLARDLNYDVVKMQEILTDGALMKDIKSISKVKEMEEKFLDTITEFEDYYIETKNQEKLDKLEVIKKNLKDFVGSGINIVNEFIMKDFEDGKKLMFNFDKESEKLKKELEPFIDYQTDKSDESGSKLIQSSNFTSQIILYSLGISFLIIIVVSIFLTKSLNEISRNFKKILTFAKDLGEGNLTSLIDIDSKDDVGEIANEFNNASQNLQSLLLKISNTGGSLNYISTKLSEISELLDKKSSDLTERSNLMAASSEEILVTNKNMSTVIDQSTKEIEFAYEQTTEMKKVFGKVIETFSDTTNEIGNMSGVVEMISDIMVSFNKINERNLKTIMTTGENIKNIVSNIESFDGAVKTSLSESSKNSSLVDDMVNNLDEIVNITNIAVDKTNTISNSMKKAEAESIKVAKEVKIVQEEANNSYKEVAKIDNGISSVNKDVNQAIDVASKATTESENASNIVEELVKSAEEIDVIVEFIEEIASQTSLLALNATIEAARAGEMGKGFAVVANEVKELAKNTTKQTDIIRSKIDSINASGKNALKAMLSTVDVIGTLNQVSRNISKSVEEQVRSSATLKSAMQNVKDKTGEIYASSNASAQLSSEVYKESQDVNKAISDVGSNINEFSTGVVDIKSNSEKIVAAIEVVKGLSEKSLILGKESLKDSEKLVLTSEDLSLRLNGLTGTATQTSVGAEHIGVKVSEMDKNIDQTSKSTDDISKIVEKLNIDSKENAKNIGEIIHVTDGMVKDVLAVSQVSEDASKASKDVLGTTQSLKILVDGMEKNINSFQLSEKVPGTTLCELYKQVESSEKLTWNSVCTDNEMDYFEPKEYNFYFENTYKKLEEYVNSHS